MLSSASWTRSLGINFVVLLQKSENFSSERESQRVCVLYCRRRREGENKNGAPTHQGLLGFMASQVLKKQEGNEGVLGLNRGLGMQRDQKEARRSSNFTKITNFFHKNQFTQHIFYTKKFKSISNCKLENETTLTFEIKIFHTQ